MLMCILCAIQDTLEDTVRDMKEFDNIHDLVNYYDALTVTEKCLTERLNEQIKRIEDLRSEIEAFTKVSFEIISCL